MFTFRGFCRTPEEIKKIREEEWLRSQMGRREKEEKARQHWNKYPPKTCTVEQASLAQIQNEKAWKQIRIKKQRMEAHHPEADDEEVTERMKKLLAMQADKQR